MTWDLLNRSENALRLCAVGRGDPDATIARVDEELGKLHASILDVHFFAGVQTVLTFEIARELLHALAFGLVRAGLELDAESSAALEKAAAATGESADVAGTLAITLAHGDPDRKHEVPAVPG